MPVLQVKTSSFHLDKIGNHSSIELATKPTEQLHTSEKLVVGELGKLAEWF
jgi:hypothetical protein